MKKLVTKFLSIGALAVLVVAACKKDGALVTATSGTGSALTASAPTLVLASANLTSTATVQTFTFTQASFGFKAGITNTLQIDAAGDNWANPYTVAMNNGVLTQSFNTADFNTIALKLGLKGGTAAGINVRVQSAVSTTTFVYSNVVALTVTPFNLKSWLYVVGAFQGWNANSPDSIYSATSNGIYVGIYNFTAGNNQFLILPQKKVYDNKIATSDNGATNTTVAVNASNNLYAPSTAGQYLVTLNLNTKTISYAASDYYSIIGDGAQGWSTDVPMKYVNDGNGNWTITLPLVSTGQFKVRQDNAWSNSWGIPNSGSAGYGVANTLNNTSNSNIPVPVSGNYYVSFMGNATPFGTAVGTAAGNNPIVTTTYSVVKQ